MGGGDGQALGFEGEADRSLLDDAVDVVSPGVAVEQADDVELGFLAEALQQPSHAARGLAAAVGEDAVVVLPETVFVEALPDGVLFNVEHEFGLTLTELNSARLDN